MTSMNLLCVDAGYVATGYAVICGGRILTAGCIRTQKSSKRRAVRVADDDLERTQVIARALAGVIRRHAVRGVIAEIPHAGAKGARAIACMARAGAIVAVVAELLAIPSEWVTPLDVKKITGSAVASKADVEKVVLARWPDAPLPSILAEREHIVDALAAFVAAENGSLVRLLSGTPT